jgi:chromosome segregation ATPase
LVREQVGIQLARTKAEHDEMSKEVEQTRNKAIDGAAEMREVMREIGVTRGELERMERDIAQGKDEAIRSANALTELTTTIANTIEKKKPGIFEKLSALENRLAGMNKRLEALEKK